MMPAVVGGEGIVVGRCAGGSRSTIGLEGLRLTVAECVGRSRSRRESLRG